MELPLGACPGAAHAAGTRSGTRETSWAAAPATGPGCLCVWCHDVCDRSPASPWAARCQLVLVLLLLLVPRQAGQDGGPSTGCGGDTWLGTGRVPAAPDATDFQTFLLCVPSTTSARNVIKRLKIPPCSSKQQMKPEMGTRWGGSARGLVVVTQHLGKGSRGQRGRVAAGTVNPVLHNPL